MKQFEYKEVSNLIEFRKTPDFKIICGVLLQFGYNSKHPEIIFVVGNKKLIGQLGLAGYNGEPIDDMELMNQLIGFQIQDESLSLAYGAALIYIVVKDGNAIGYQVPFDKAQGVYYGNDWSSSQLGAIFENVKKRGRIYWEE